MPLIRSNPIHMVNVPVPPPEQQVFHGGISHKDLWLWDSWTYRAGETVNLYCLALSRTLQNGEPITPPERNKYPFHIRHFRSLDSGVTWLDMGCFFKPEFAHTYMSRNIWSGGMTPLGDGRILFGFTGIANAGPDHQFRQSIGIGICDEEKVLSVQPEPISCPLRDYDMIRKAGYYLGKKSALGANNGEDGGPIMAWRDPYFVQTEKSVEAFWSAKISPEEGCVAHATMAETGNGFYIETLHPPIIVPKEDKVTQTEIPKIYGRDGNYLLLIAACNRLYEGQPDSDVSKMTRLYRSQHIRGPWSAYHEEGSDLTDTSDLFGMSIINYDMNMGRIEIIAPISEMAPEEYRLTISSVRSIDITMSPKQVLRL